MHLRSSCFATNIRGDQLRIYRQKLRVNGLPSCEDGIIRFDTVPGVMDRRRDRWTDRQTDRIAVAKTALSIDACCKTVDECIANEQVCLGHFMK